MYAQQFLEYTIFIHCIHLSVELAKPGLKWQKVWVKKKKNQKSFSPNQFRTCLTVTEGKVTDQYYLYLWHSDLLSADIGPCP